MSTLVIENLPEKIIFDKSKDLKEAGNEPCRFLEKENSRPKKKKKKIANAKSYERGTCLICSRNNSRRLWLTWSQQLHITSGR